MVVDAKSQLLEGLTPDHQARAVASPARRLLVVAGAGSGKTEVMARRVAWWIGIDGVPRDRIAAFTFTENAAEEMKFRIRKWIATVTPDDEDTTLGRMSVSTIHAFCVDRLRDLLPGRYGMYDVLDEVGRLALVERGFNRVLGLQGLRAALGVGHYRVIDDFLLGYDLLNEYHLLDVELPPEPPPASGRLEREWVEQARLRTRVADDPASRAFAESAARYYAYLHARRFLDFSTSQGELVRILERDADALADLRDRYDHIVVDELQDVNPIQDRLVRLLLGDDGQLTAVGDHRQAIFAWRGGRVDLMAAWHRELQADLTGEVVSLPHNFRATPRLIELANRWSDTITTPGTLASPPMLHGRTARDDLDPTHVASLHFGSREDEAEWIAATVRELVDASEGAAHDKDEASERGIGLSDIALLVRSSSDVRTYMSALEDRGVPSIVRAGPDLFAQPEVLLALGALGIAAGIERFFGGGYRSIETIAAEVLGCTPEPEALVESATETLQEIGLPIDVEAPVRLVRAAQLIRLRLDGATIDRRAASTLRTKPLVEFLRRRGELRRVFPQTIFHWLAAEAGVGEWDAAGTPRARAAMFHLGQLSKLLAGVETPGWVRPDSLKWQVIAIAHWGARNARTDEAPLLVPPDAVTISTVHSAKGLEFPVVFLADVKSRRFPSNQARRVPALPFSGYAAEQIDPRRLADNDRYDDERRLMYVALTRAERYLFVTSPESRSAFKRELDIFAEEVGGVVDGTASEIPAAIRRLPSEFEPARRLVTSFSDLRYYLECPHDYYLRKVLGFAPTIDQAFGYGRGIHALMREVHSDPARWAALVADPGRLADEVRSLIDDGFFYLRYTTGEPLRLMQNRAQQVVGEYVQTYRAELAGLTFEPERAFETLLEEANVLVSGAIDLVRRDDPPTVTLIDFKSGDPEKQDSNASALDSEEMALQISLYGLAARRELQYAPELGLVRYLGAKPGAPLDDRELQVPLDDGALSRARTSVIDLAEGIQQRRWDLGPRRRSGAKGRASRCGSCDFLLLCGRPEARSERGR